MKYEVNNSQSEMDLTLFVACYNEERDITDTLDTVVAAMEEISLSYEIVIIDDASTDNSVKQIRKYMSQHPALPITLKVNKVNQGLAQNFIEGAFMGRGEYYRLICGDNVEPKERLVTIFQHIGEADMIIPYPVETIGKSLLRRLISRTFTAIINFISGYSIKYYNGLTIHLRYDVMRWHTNYHGFGFQADMITRLLDEGSSYIEVSVVAHERTSGTSKALTLKNFLSVTHTLLDLSIRRIAKIMYNRKPTRQVERRSPMHQKLRAPQTSIGKGE